MVRIITVSAIILLGSACNAERNPAKETQSEAPLCEKVCDKDASDKTKPGQKDTLEQILHRLSKQTGRLRTYQANVEYLVTQDPELLDSKTLRKGRMYYKKDDRLCRIRVDFETLKQDDAEEEKYRERFIFDGVWLTKIDYQLEKVDFYQQAPKDKPVDVFTRISEHFPLIGFSGTEQMAEQFDIDLVAPPTTDPNEPVVLHLKVKKDSIYKDSYSVVNFWIDNRTSLPGKVVATSPEGDILDIRFSNFKVNKKLENSIFKLEIPEGFDKNRHSLKEE